MTGTVGIVIVSHSATLARGVVELAREMAGPDVAIVEAGGTAGAADVLGTDAVRVAAAIEQASSPAGVIVLMDLGSAVLSAELALELVVPAVRAGVVLCEAPLVEGAVSAAVAAGLGRPLADVAAEAVGALDAKREHLGRPGPAGGEHRPPAAAGEGTGEDAGEAATGREVRLTVSLPHGLHARPAARLVATVGRFDAAVAVTNLTTGKGPADGRSLNGLAMLGARLGDELAVRATGAEASRVLDAVVELAAADFGESLAAAGPVPARAVPAPAPPTRPPRGGQGRSLTGLAASPGVAVGPARHLRRSVPKVPTGRVRGAGEEWAAFEHALEATRDDLRAARRSVASTAGEEAAAIFDVHLLYLDDDALIGPTRRGVFEAGANAAEAWQAAVNGTAGAYRGLDDPYLRARGADVEEVGLRLLSHLVGQGPAAAVTEAGVVVAASASPQELATLDPALATGLATAAGGPLDHGAILARALGIPAVVGLGEAVLGVPEGSLVVLDGDAGVLHVEPGPQEVARFDARRTQGARAARAALASAGSPAVTRDGRRVLVEANVGWPGEIDAVMAAGADGVGLLRTEFLFLDRVTAPGEEEQFEAYAAMAARLDGRPLVVRTLDAGADKDLPWLADREPESNPALGVRGLRLGLVRPGLLTTQLRAVVRAAARHPGTHVMFPMVTTVGELRRARELLAEATAALAAAGRAVPDHLDVGIMVEVPAAALAASHLAAEAAFLSIGTNDLTQYTLAADRTNRQVAALADGLAPAVLGLVELVVTAGVANGRPVAVCGALAADPVAVPLLVGLGVDRLSVPPTAVPGVKQAIRDLDAGRAAELARRCLQLDSAEAVRALVSGS